jgi:hypothetical protein
MADKTSAVRQVGSFWMRVLSEGRSSRWSKVTWYTSDRIKDLVESLEHDHSDVGAASTT